MSTYCVSFHLWVIARATGPNTEGPTVGEQLLDDRPTKNAALTATCNTAPEFPY